jgi:hypothetical protein
MPRVGFEPTIPVFERANTVYALDRATTVIGALLYTSNISNAIDIETYYYATARKHLPYYCMITIGSPLL